MSGLGDHPQESAPFLVKARLMKPSTDDGAMSVKDSLHVGDCFIIDISTKATVPMQGNGNRIVLQEVVRCAEDGKWLPWECLEILV